MHHPCAQSSEVELADEDLVVTDVTPKLKFVVDCQALCNILNGDVALDANVGNNFRPILVRTARQFAALLGEGWRPFLPHLGLCRWRCRGKNKLADRLCNATMDLKKSRFSVDEVLVRHHLETRTKGGDCRIISFSDGGKRDGGGGAAAAWVLVDTSRRTLASRGTFRGSGDTICSFTAEMVALESVVALCHAKFTVSQIGCVESIGARL